MAIYYPQWRLTLSVPVAGTSADKIAQETEDNVVTFDLPVHRFRHEKNNHNVADVLEVETSWKSAGVDPRILSNAVGVFALGDSKGDPNWQPSGADVRFVGVMQRPRRSGGEGEGLTLSLLFHDYTSLFIAEKPFVSAGVPAYSETLSQAWARICDHVGPADDDGNTLSVVSVLRDRLRFTGDAKDVVLGSAVADRFMRLGHVPVKHETDAWAVWQQCVGMTGLISHIDRDECVVTTATDYYTSKNPPRLVWGKNIAKISEERDAQRVGAGVILTSFDPMSGSTTEAFWPPVGDDRVKRKHLSAKKAESADDTLQAEKREAFAVPGITNALALEKYAQRVWEERSRQELSGRLQTYEMKLDAADGSTFDLLTLSAGDVVRIEVNRADLEYIGSLGPLDAVSFLVGRGYEPDVAKLLVKNMQDLASLPPNFFVDSVTIAGDADAESFEVDIVYKNRIQIDGSAT